jgi:transcriptional regulator with XRE-family HTH domain
MDIARHIDYIESFEEFEKYYTDELIDGNILLGKYLDALLKRHGFNASSVSKEIGYDESYLRKMIKNKRENPDRDILLATCIVIGATVEETQVLLRYAGVQPLYARRKRDAIIWYALLEGEKLTPLDDFLDSRGYKMLKKNEG